MSDFRVDDTVWIYWQATEQWEPANYRGKWGQDMACIVKGMSQMLVPIADLKKEKPDETC